MARLAASVSLAAVSYTHLDVYKRQAYNEDLLANWRAFRAAPGCAFCDFAGYHYRQHADSASHRALPPQSLSLIHI